MKLQDFAFAIAQKVFQELEHTHHYAVPEQMKKDILEKIQKEHGQLVG